jgi:hypothetical protein
VDVVLVVDGSLREEQARPSPHGPEATTAPVIGSDGAQLSGGLPRGVDQTRCGPTQRPW